MRLILGATLADSASTPYGEPVTCCAGRRAGSAVLRFCAGRYCWRPFLPFATGLLCCSRSLPAEIDMRVLSFAILAEFSDRDILRVISRHARRRQVSIVARKNTTDCVRAVNDSDDLIFGGGQAIRSCVPEQFVERVLAGEKALHKSLVDSGLTPGAETICLPALGVAGKPIRKAGREPADKDLQADAVHESRFRSRSHRHLHLRSGPQSL